MNKSQRTTLASGWRLTALMVLAVGILLGAHVRVADAAAAPVNCAAFPPGTTDPGTDSDGDGFTDFQECNGITLANGVVFPSCVTNPNLPRNLCLDPNSKDLFVIVVPATPSLLTAPSVDAAGNLTFPLALPCVDVPNVTVAAPCFNPYAPGTAGNGGFTALGVTAHQITGAFANLDRTVLGTPASCSPTPCPPQKAARVSESIDTSSTLMGQCQFGTPDGLDGCVVFTQRIKNVITTNCGNNTATQQGQFFSDYVTHTFIHEAGHSIGGLTTTYNSRYGGNHYPAASSKTLPLIMEQYENYTTSRGQCTFNSGQGIALPPSGWNLSSDPPGVILK